MFESIPVGDVDDELRLARVLLGRLWKQQNEFGGTLQLHELTEYDVPHRRSGKLRNVTRRVPDYIDEIVRQLGRIGDLELKRAQLMAVGRNRDNTPAPPAVPVKVLGLIDAVQPNAPHIGDSQEQQA